MGRYRKVEVRTWGDEKFRRLSPIPPCGQGLWLFLITGSHTGPIPGLFKAGRAGMAEELGWPPKAFDEAFGEALGEGMVEADFDARVVWVPNAIKHNRPESPNVVISWGPEFDLIPECPLKWKARAALASAVAALGEPFGKAFEKAFGKPSTKSSAKTTRKTMANQEQEQEQEQEQDTPAREKKARTPAPHVAIFEEEARAAGLTPAVAKADAIQLAEARKKFPDDDAFRAAVRRYLQLQDKFLVENSWAGRFIGSRLQALMNPGRTSDTAFPPTKTIGTKYANTPTVRI